MESLKVLNVSNTDIGIQITIKRRSKDQMGIKELKGAWRPLVKKLAEQNGLNTENFKFYSIDIKNNLAQISWKRK